MTGLIIRNNLLLSTCEVESVCGYLGGSPGAIIIHDNAPGCNSQYELTEACTGPCLPEGITFTTQAEVDSFQINYPYCIGIDGDVEINGDDIINLDNLNVLTSIGGYLKINFNDILTSLSGLDNIDTASIDELTIVYNNELSTCEIQSVCDYLVNPNAVIEIHDNAAGCNNQQEVAEACIGPCLPDGINFSTQAQIDNFQINYPYCIGIEGDVEINGDDINNLNGLSSVTEIGGNLFIYNNNALKSVTGFENLNSVGGNLLILANDSLTSLTALDSMTLVDGDITIGINGSLKNLVGLENIDASSISVLTITSNDSLTDCNTITVCQFLVELGGESVINNNAPGCNSAEEVIEICINPIEEIGFGNEFNISPNPLESTSWIRYTLNQSSPVILQILDLAGREMLTLVDEVRQPGEQSVIFNTSGLPVGIYFCVLKTNNGKQTRKIIKL